MPNSRRRRFSVHNGIAGRERDHCKIQNNGMQSSVPAKELEPKASNLVSTKSCKLKNKIQPSSSKNSNNLDKTSDSAMSMHTIIIKNTSSKTDKDVTASSSNIDMCNVLQSAHDELDQAKDLGKAEVQSKRTKPIPHEKHHHQHRIKVRSPKRRGTTISPPNLPRPKTTDDTTDIINTIPEDIPMPIKSIHSTGTDVIDWNKETDILCIDTVETIENDARQSDHSLNDMCRICHGGDSLSHELGPLISACACRGTVGRVHVKCLERWLTESGKSRCELCGTRYATRRVHRYGVPRALVMWILSQNAKQLMVDSLGIMLMSPLAVLAAWLSGRTLAGLMTQDSRGTPWPLASTFVLACMTLVCYYCWIVSAATRHALGWWIWYRSQYEVRLTLENDD